MNNLKEKLAKITAASPSDWKTKVKYRRENRDWLRKSALIAVRILDVLKEQGKTQKELAQQMNVSPQQINKIVQGQENLTLETISALEAALGITLIDEKAISGKGTAKE